MNNFLKTLLDFVLPDLCVSCEAPVEKKRRFICNECWKKLIMIQNQPEWYDRNLIRSSFSLFEFREDTEIQKIIHAFKYSGMKSIGIILGEEIGKLLKEKQADYILPVPLHIAKLRERKYNQSLYIAKGIEKVTGWKVLEEALKRINYTKSQTGLNFSERQKNVSGAFRVNKRYSELLRGSSVLITDDVITTGATINECAKILKDAGVREIHTASCAFAGGN
ncbi:MAG: ComF family protein [Ignavibacteria bacterium]|nr:ComF family protein [Ignavibacteria bacterium]